MTGRVSPVVWAILWTLFLPGPAVVLSALAGELLPTRLTNNIASTLRPASPEAGYDEAKWSLHGVGPTSNSIDEGALRLKQGSRTSVLEFQVRDKAYWLTGGQATATGNPPARVMDAAAIAEWIATNTNRPNDENVNAEATELLGYLKGVHMGQGITTSSESRFTGAGYSANSGYLPHRWFGPLAIVFWLVIWLVGVVLIFRRERRRKLTAGGAGQHGG
jgi:hypothetical protein